MKFTVGQELVTMSICDANCRFEGKVLSRTEHFVTIRDPHGNRRRCKVEVVDGSEMIYPLGKYSMCPVFRP